MNKSEISILKALAERKLMTKADILKFLELNGVKKDAETLVNTVTQSLVKKGYATFINPLGSTCYMITRDGSKFLDSF